MSVKEHQLELDLKCKDAVIGRMRSEIQHMKTSSNPFNSTANSYYMQTEPAPMAFADVIQPGSIYPGSIHPGSITYQNDRRILDEFKETLSKKTLDLEQALGINKSYELEVATLKARLLGTQVELGKTKDELNNLKQHLAENDSDVKMIKFVHSKDKSVIAESKKLIEDYKSELGMHQLKYLDIKRYLDVSKKREFEQASLIDKLNSELKLNDQRLQSRDDEIELLKSKCTTLIGENELSKYKKLDLEKVVDGLVEEINQLRIDDEACRKILDRRDQIEKIRSFHPRDISTDNFSANMNISLNKSPRLSKFANLS